MTASERERRRIAALAGLLVVVAAVTLLVLRGCAGGSGGPPSFDALKLVPAEALVLAHVSTDTDREPVERMDELLRRFGAYEPQRDALLTRLAGAEGDIDPQRDVAPWLGDEALIALLDAGQTTAGSLVLVEVTDREGAQAFLDRNPREATVREYKETPVASYGSVATAFVGDFLAVGQSLTVQGAIDRAMEQGESIDELPLFGRTIGTLPEERAATIWATGDGLRRLLAPQAGVLGSAALLLDQPGLQAVGLSAQATGDADRARVVAHSVLDPAQRRTAGVRATSFEPQLLDAAPADVIAYLGASGISGALGRLVASAVGGGDAESAGPLLTRLRERLQRAAPTLERDLLAVLGGEVGFVVTPAVPAPVLSLVARAEDPARTREALRRLQAPLVQALAPAEGEETEGAAAPAPAPRFVPADVEGTEAFTLSLGGPTGISYGVFDDRLVLSTSLEGLRAVGRADGALAGSDAFSAVLADRPEQVSSVGFLDFSQLLELGEQTGLNDSRAYLAARDDLRRVQAVGVSSTGAEDQSTSEILLSIP